MSEDFLLEMKNVHKSFPGVHALKGINFKLKKGEVHALLGENGAGKSTLIKVLGGIYIPEEGEIFINDVKTEINNVKDAKNNGISIIHQELILVPHMTVAENIFLGREPMKSGLLDTKKMLNDAQKLLESNNMHIDASKPINKLSIAEQQMVEIVKAISFESKILVMDEPTSSIAEKEVEFLFETIRLLVKKGVGIIYISHKMSELEDICDRVTILRDGKYIGTEIVKDTTKDKLIAMMVGRELENYYTRDFQHNDEVILKCENISDGKIVKESSFELRKGEIVGFSGLIGAGRTELMKCVFGLTEDYKGDIYFEGKKVNIDSTEKAMKLGISFVPEDRKLEAIYKLQSVRYNSTIEVLGEFIKGIFVNSKKENDITNKYIKLMSTKTPTIEQQIGNLSGGNQQKVIIGRWLANNPKILILDEPTRGVDVGAKSEIYAIMNDLVKGGMSVIMISSELPEIINMSDRVYVMNDGKVTGCLSHEEVSQERIMQLAAK